MDDERRKRVWKLLSNSEEFDRFMAKKFPNLKRYGKRITSNCSSR